MGAVAIIPARGGSKGVPGKNLRPVGGIPLVARAIRTARSIPAIEHVVVSTDDAAIAEVARKYGALVVDRPAELANDTASSESALLHALTELEQRGITAPVTVFIQATSPFIPANSLANAVAEVDAGRFDVKFSAVETYGFIWKLRDGNAAGVNHDHSFRQRRQDREPEYLETGAFYVMNTAGFRDSKFRFFGRIGIEVVPESTAIEIDDFEQLELSQLLAARHDFAAEAVIPAKALVMDFDGVHTDDTASVNQSGEESVRVSRADGFGLGKLHALNFPLLILSKERNPVVAARGAKLKIETIQGIDNKIEVLTEWAKNKGIALKDVAYVGNDLNDLECLQAVGWPIVPADAHPALNRIARVITSKPGGRGALREVADQILNSLKQRD